MKSFFSFRKIDKWQLVFLLLFFSFSLILMWKTFFLNKQKDMQIATKAWSDFAATIPLIRSFSLGNNFPPEYPLFPGPPIRYHFVFFLLVAFLEKIGVRLDVALNTLSALSFFTLLLSIYFIGKVVFKNKAIGVLSVILFTFNSSLGFFEFFKKHPISLETPLYIIKNNQFSSFGPYDGKIVSAFWSLNIFTNQRHLALAYSLFLLTLLYIYQKSNNPKKFSYFKAIFISLIIGVFPFIHLAVFGMIILSLLIFLLIYKKIRLKIFIILLISLTLALPQILYMGPSEVKVNFLRPGYLIEELNIINFLKYWFLNLGLTTIIAPLGVFLANKKQRTLFLPFLALFVVGNVFQFSPEIAANHKFFNLFVIGANFFTSLTLLYFFKKSLQFKIFSTVLLFFLTLTGVIDFFPILNDSYMIVKDIPNNKAATFINQSTPKNSVFLNSSFLYHPASIAGRKIFMGWPYFPWSVGYDTNKRGVEFNLMYTSYDKELVCSLLRKNNIDYITTENTEFNRDLPKINTSFFQNNFKMIYKDNESNIEIFEIYSSCGKAE